MLLLTLKLLLAPILVAGGSAAQKRWGQAVGGRLVGLPLTSLPLLFILVVAQGTRFAATAAAATLAGVTGQAVLTWTYARVAHHHGPVATLGAAVASFAVTAAALALVAPGPVAAAVLATLVLGVLLHFWPANPPVRTTPTPATGVRSEAPGGGVRSEAPGGGARAGAPDRGVATGHSTLLRMVLAATFSFAVSELASPLGPNLAGLVTALPVLSLVMFALTHRDDGAGAAMEFSHGVQRGSFSVVTALLVLALALPTGHVVLAFGSAIIASVLAQVVAGVAEHHTDPVGPTPPARPSTRSATSPVGPTRRSQRIRSRQPASAACGISAARRNGAAARRPPRNWPALGSRPGRMR